MLDEQGAERFFGEPALQLKDLMHCDFSGRGVISLLDASTLIHRSPIGSSYELGIDRESAYELLKKKASEAARAQQAADKAQRQTSRSNGGGSGRQSIAEAMMKSAARTIGSQLGRQIIRGVLGSIFGKR